MSHAAALDDLMQVATRLSQVMDAENHALAAGKIEAVAALTAEKDKLVSAYAARLKALKAEPEAAKSAAAERRDELTVLAERLRAIAAENEVALRARRDANTHLLGAVIKAAERRQGGASGYSGAGDKTLAPANAPLSLFHDRRL